MEQLQEKSARLTESEAQVRILRQQLEQEKTNCTREAQNVSQLKKIIEGLNQDVAKAKQ